MLHSFFQAICRVGIFMICAQAILHFRAKEAYEKYLKLLVSTMILIQLLLPIGNLLAGKGGLQAESVLEEFGKELEQEMRAAEENAAAADAILEQMTLEEIRNYVEQPAEEIEQEREGSGNRIEVEEIKPISIGEPISIGSSASEGEPASAEQAAAAE
ncbi:MAG: hypothetical protein HFH91_17355 [Lachnospiraceae bacterium]|nr:hypothetical protein [Lachnospiraceae bacterium]